MKTVNMHEAKTNLSRLVEGALHGEPFVIARAGKPLVKVEALESDAKPEPKLFGFLKDEWGAFAYDPEVDRQLDKEVAELFEQSIRDSPLDWGTLGSTSEEADEPAASDGRRGAA